LAGSELSALRGEGAARLGVPSIDDADRAVRAAIEKALKVENAAELDETLDQLNFARRNYESASTRDTSERSPMRVFELGSRFIVGWQKFLVYRAAGNVGMAKLAVQDLAR